MGDKGVDKCGTRKLAAAHLALLWTGDGLEQAAKRSLRACKR